MSEKEGQGEAQGQALLNIRVRPLDTAAEGSYLKRKAIFALMARMARGEDAETASQAADALEAYIEAESLVAEHIDLPEGRSLDEVLALLSGDQFDELLGAILGKAKAPQ